MNPPPAPMAAADMPVSTPSPTASNGSAPTVGTPNTGAGTPGNNSASANAASRRPPRKSTLTQQQKNQKRQRATQDQLVLLEHEFNKNPTPTAAVRERIAQEINMTERSVQIWFQNRRAKIKLLAKKSIETGEDCDAIPDSYRHYLAVQAIESGKPLNRNFFQQPMLANGMFLPPEHQSPQKVVIHHFQCRSLSIGTWRRVGQNAMDLVIFYSLGDKPCLTYYINNDAAGYKIEFPFAYIKNITLESGQSGPNMRPAGLVVELNQPPNFFMDNAGSGGFNQCGDFTEDQQASQVLVHHLGGDPRVLSGQLAKLTLLESFQNRHNPMFNNSSVAVSAPVSPIGRPASQPNVMAPPPMPHHQENPFGMSLQPGPRGHKRQRSRSVPAITDFSFLSQPMPSFHIQHPSTTITDPSIFAPIPQQPNNLSPAHPLRINTAPHYGLDFGRQYPMSAAATGSPSEFGSPAFFGPGGEVESMSAAHLQPSYTLPFMSPMAEHTGVLHPTPSPLSAVSHGDPVIADQSPPLANMHRSASADFLSMPQDSGAMTEDSFLAEMYPKGNFQLPFRGNTLDDMALQEEPSSEELDLQHSMNFSTIDPSTLSAGNHGL